MDPPRKGADERFLKSVLTLKPKKIIYISCEPETLARDIKLLSSKYNIESIQPVDMFPQTHHVETIVGLALKK
jgi:tRNA/tmRNA/rRNA uracil-C5-methylase (TrmA/RlmC/RlmD family)